MEGTDIFTFGHHPGVDLYECNISAKSTCGNCSACGTYQASARRRALGSSGRRRAPSVVSDPNRRRRTVASDPDRRRAPPVVSAPSRRRSDPSRRRTSSPSSPAAYNRTYDNCSTQVCGASGRRRGRRMHSDSSSGAWHRMHDRHVNPYFPRVHQLEFWLPEKPHGQSPVTLDTVDGIVGVALNSALLVHEHPGEGMTWLLDNCGGHGDQFGHYHYHAPPLCLLRNQGVLVPSGSWWKDIGPDAWPLDGPEVQIGWAMDGARIMSPYRGGKRVDPAVLDACHGVTDPRTGEYRYYIVLIPPFLPPCLKGALGAISGYRTLRGGSPCKRRSLFTDALREGPADRGRHLLGTGCPGHSVFEEVTAGAPFGWPYDPRMLSRNLEACPCGGAGSDPCLGQLFCALSLTQNVGGLPRSIAQGDVDTHVITIDGQQDLENVSYTVEDGRMKASAVRPLITGDGTDLELVPGSLYYLIMTVGSTNCGVNQNVSYHDPSALQSHVCLMTLSTMFECKPAAEWPDMAPTLSTVSSSTSTSMPSSSTVTSSSAAFTAISTTTSSAAWEWESGPSLPLSDGAQEAKPVTLALAVSFLLLGFRV
ncbi:unnamed protein product [Symbiodinium microadriaticum]|nr:unnamed protein product [Symbiodinium microadriaticum]